jgi:hypothetical protein
MVKDNIKDLKYCPICNFQWQHTENIYESLRQNSLYENWTNEEVKQTALNYGHSTEHPKHFSELIGIEISEEYDGISQWQCPNCKTTWNKFTNNIIRNE